MLTVLGAKIMPGRFSLFLRDCLPLLFVIVNIIFLRLSIFDFVESLSEKEILLSFKNSIRSDPFKSLSSWDFSGDSPCRNWTGISCNSAGEVEKVVLQNTGLVGNLSGSLASLSSLRILILSGNGFYGNIPSVYSQFGKLLKLNLSRNSLSGEIPDSVGDIASLRMLDLSRNSFVGVIPYSLFKNCGKMRYVSLSHNELNGSIPSSLSNCGMLTGFDFSHNYLDGNVPEEVWGGVPNLVYVSLSNNSLFGEVTGNVSSCRRLQHFDISINLFYGSLPPSLLSLSNLAHLDVADNMFTSALFPEILGSVVLNYFNGSFNRLQGEFPEIRSCSNQMQILDVSHNNFSGNLNPSIFRYCGYLEILDAGSNRLRGSIPVEIENLKSLTKLSLGNNLITGAIPSQIGSSEFLQVLDLKNLQLFGEIPIALCNCRLLLELDLSGNRLQGSIPEVVYNMSNLEILDLHSNTLSGIIPSDLGELVKLKLLDLSDNRLSGKFPASIKNLTQLTYLNVSYNNLSGPIPTSATLQNFGAASFTGNPGLCGPPLDKSCSGNPSSAGKNRLLSVTAITAIVVAALIFLGVCTVMFLNFRELRRTQPPEILVSESTPQSTGSNLIIGKLVLFSKSLPSKYEDWEAGTKALLDKDSIIGGGVLGTVYKTTLEAGVTIAVKKLETLGRIRSQEEFEQEISRLGSLQHPNLVPMQGYYWSSTMQLIISEFIPNGNLFQQLHESSHSGSTQNSLQWDHRFNIAIGVAKVLAYLHHDCHPQILHLNIKSTNILLDEGYEPKLSDYGFGKLLSMMANYGETNYHDSVGYIAPEIALQGFFENQITEKCDVYSYGMVLLELVTGRKTVEAPSAREVFVLLQYVNVLLARDRASALIDPNLRGYADNEMMQVLNLGIMCTSSHPPRRPTMAEVVQVLESIKTQFR